jgi:pyrroloquinoline quinone biosynthesis protein B
MHIRVLGAAAGGGFPQWNCSCPNCWRLRLGQFAGQPRSQAQLAISADDVHWFLINASPDLRSQIDAFPPLHPLRLPLRNSPIAGIVLTSAEVDAALGLLLLREFQPLTVYATGAVRQILIEDNSLFEVLKRLPDQVHWVRLIPGVAFALGDHGLKCIPVSAASAFPGFVAPARAAQLVDSEAVLGFFFEHGGHRVAFFPGAPCIYPEWLDQMQTCDAIFFDGTFWSDDELIRLHGDGKTARQMGHHPVTETLTALSDLKARKIFIHINNTNPMLDEESDEYRTVRSAGWEIAFDGMDVVL